MAKRRKYTEKDFPPVGSVFASQTADGRYAVGRVLRIETEKGEARALIAASSWLGNEIPATNLPVIFDTLIKTHHSWKRHPEILWVNHPMPDQFRIIGQVTLSHEDLNAVSNTFGGWESIPLQVLTQWRWDHEREALLQEEAAKAAAEAERRVQNQKIRDEFMKSLTLPSLAQKDWLEDWSDEVPANAKLKSAELLKQLVAALAANSKRTKAATRKLLKQTVESLNQLDSVHSFIHTVEREDLCEALTQIVCAAGFPMLADDIDQLRDW